MTLGRRFVVGLAVYLLLVAFIGALGFETIMLVMSLAVMIIPWCVGLFYGLWEQFGNN